MLIVSACWSIPWLNTCVLPNVFNVECEQVNEIGSCNVILTWLFMAFVLDLHPLTHQSNISVWLRKIVEWTPTYLKGLNWQSLWFAIAKEMEQFSSMIQWTTLCCKAVEGPSPNNMQQMGLHLISVRVQTPYLTCTKSKNISQVSLLHGV